MSRVIYTGAGMYVYAQENQAYVPPPPPPVPDFWELEMTTGLWSLENGLGVWELENNSILKKRYLLKVKPLNKKQNLMNLLTRKLKIWKKMS
ncbi:hypothetical protein UFOVP733_48 [uncultured Caudovirales phage]|uniref:Uncharacterized protein n=1 Tax=uncultured Caudovirales phage TaxID=2100421 RepID=A0A6J7X2U8_9CAUD|nr:hypothetical protein UFOVP733_48 [uncultured Caudovirales phage]CAB5224819.1 hypothetical protein UFOVP743_11 [uncultured Caudovirales phage]